MAPKVPPKFDQARLQQMTEPLTVRVERVKGNTKSMVPLPPKEGYIVGGPGWTIDEVMGLEQWIVKEWSGGGTYVFQVTDSSQPNPVTMEWTQVFNYPERVPPLMADAVVAPVLQPQPQPPQQSHSGMPWPPPAAQWAGMPPVPQAGAPNPNPMYFASPWGAPAPWATSPPPWFQVPQSTPLGGKGSEVDQLKAENERLRLQQQEERHQAQIRAQEERHQQQLAALREEMRRLTERPAGPDPAVLDRIEREREARLAAERAAERAEWEAKIAAIQAANARPAGPDPAVEALRLQMEAERQRREEDRRLDEIRRQSEERERRLQDELRALREDRNRGPDPMIMMIVDQIKSQAETQREIARLNSEAQKEAARSNAEVVRELRTQMIHPSEMFRMYREASSGQDQIIRSTVNTLNDVFGTAQQWFQTMMQQMSGQGESPVVRLIEGGMGQIKDMADRWFSTRAQAEVARANAVREQARAQAAAMGWQPPPPLAQPTNGAVPSNGQAASPPLDGLNGAGNGAAQPAAPAAPTPTPEQQKLRKGGKTDVEWFGVALSDVEALRKVAAEFVESVSSDPPRLNKDGFPHGVGPDQAAMFIIRAASIIRERKAKGEPGDVLAFSYLFENEMYPDLVEVLLPDVPQGYRDDLLHFLYGMLEGKQPEQIMEELRAKHGDDGDGDDDNATRPPPTAAPLPA